MEIWLPVVSYDGLYEVSDLGRVRSLDRSKWNGRCFYVQRGRVLSQKPNVRSGYVHVNLCKDGIAESLVAHRLVLEAFVGPCPEGMECCHNNGVRHDIRLLNLRWDTIANNHADKHLHGTSRAGKALAWIDSRGVNNGQAKIDDSIVRQMFKMRAEGLLNKEIAERISMSNMTVSLVLRRKSWSHVVL